ncbi:MAG: MFS transporter [Acidobacteria bacterium]|nr:MFS transporter [Acidobacteriota bacterium]MBI3655532.1 MFS transporter [Acidobacteriota bacterium]
MEQSNHEQNPSATGTIDDGPTRLPAAILARNQLSIYLSAGLIFGGFTVVMPFLPLYVKQLGISDVAEIALWSGLLFSVTPMLAAALGPFWGKLGDRFGLKVMAQRVTISMVVSWALFGFAANVYHLLALRILLGLFGGFNAVALALLTQGCTGAQIGSVIGRLQTVQITSTALGPLVGGFLADHVGIRQTCLVTAALCLISLLSIVFWYREPPSRVDRPKTRVRADNQETLQPAYSTLSLLKWPNFAVVALLLLSIQFLDRTLGPIIPLYVTALGTAEASIAKTAGLIVSVGALASALSALLIGDRLNKASPKRLLIITLFCGALISVPLAFVRTSNEFLVLRGLLGLFVGGSITIAYAIGALNIPAGGRGASFGLFSSAGLLGGSLGPIIAGLLTRYSFRTVFLVNAAMYLALIPLVLCCLRWPKGQPPGAQLSPTTEGPLPSDE